MIAGKYALANHNPDFTCLTPAALPYNFSANANATGPYGLRMDFDNSRSFCVVYFRVRFLLWLVRRLPRIIRRLARIILMRFACVLATLAFQFALYDDFLEPQKMRRHTSKFCTGNEIHDARPCGHRHCTCK